MLEAWGILAEVDGDVEADGSVAVELAGGVVGGDAWCVIVEDAKGVPEVDAGGVLVDNADEEVLAREGDPGDGGESRDLYDECVGEDVGDEESVGEDLGDEECTGDVLEDSGEEASSVTVAGWAVMGPS